MSDVISTQIGDFMQKRGMTSTKPEVTKKIEEPKVAKDEVEIEDDDEIVVDGDDDVEDDDVDDTSDDSTDVSDDSPKSSEMQQLLEQNQELTRSVQILMSKVQGMEQAAPKAPKPKSKPIDFLEGIEDFDDVISNKESFNQLLNRVYSKGVEDSLGRASSVVTPVVDNQIKYNNFVNDFFSKRPDVAKYQDYFYSVADSIRSSNPSITIGELFSTAESKVRKNLNLPTKPNTQDKKSVKKRKVIGATPGASASRGNAEDDSSTQSQMLKMLKLKGLR